MSLIPLHPMDFFQQMDAEPGRCLVVFSAPACGGCKRIRRLFDASPALSVPCFEVNAEDAGFLLEEFNVQHLPGVLCFEAGEYRHEITDIASIDSIERDIWDK